MAVTKINPTHNELINLKNKLVTAHKGLIILKEKHDELTRQLYSFSKEKDDLRAKVELELKEANELISFAECSMGKHEVKVALLNSDKTFDVSLETKDIFNITVPEFSFVRKRNNELYGYAFSSGDLDSAVEKYNCVFPLMIKLSQVEKTCDLLKIEISAIKKRINALEFIMIPQYKQSIRSITVKLEVTERNDNARLQKIKSIMLSKKQSII